MKESIAFILVQTINTLTTFLSKSIYFIAGNFRVEIRGDYPKK